MMILTYLEDQNAGRSIAAAREVLSNTKGQPALSTVDNIEFLIPRKASLHVVGRPIIWVRVRRKVDSSPESSVGRVAVLRYQR
jgi:hypothetical protein